MLKLKGKDENLLDIEITGYLNQIKETHLKFLSE
jgi:hypothetical protein